MKTSHKLAIGAGVAALGTIAVRYLRGARTIARHVDDYAQHWGRGHHHTDGVIHYVALGDSAAQGVGASSVEASYVSIIAERLREATRRPVVVTNLSVSGTVSGDVVRDQLPVLRDLRFTPDLVTLDIGGNDVVFSGSNTVESFAASLDTILGELPAGSFVGDVPWFTLPNLGVRAKKMSDVAAKLVKLHGHHLVPLFEATKQTGYLRFHRHTAGDWFHPNDKGYLAWADLFWAELVASGRVAELTPPAE
ncbi:SGNH/GDSL hydrolase family protein [Tessaracoccus lacteus]|uniref:SGNH/GDSL hydrolase family protein n=1 Tax=Tessaracoccus lacteus TaxID=3041766 RepID=A0ABY8PX98_9ACTN|nr:SGNH/GDSL hydrolase family protein [Tessaracoccus sp. T21]WGT47109.1 SGNH/GDSL hydrolase family protein [Tessaracoccus sp. T21]